MGILPYTIGNHCINHCLLYCKYYIHVQHTNKKKPKVENFKTYYKNILNLEKTLYVLRNETKLFDNLFKRIMELFQNF